MKKMLFAAATIAVISTGALAQSITTLFASNNSGSPGGGVYFDVTVAAAPLIITGFDVNTTLAAGSSFGFQVYNLLGTSVGNETNPGAWTLMSAGTGVSAGLDAPSAVTLDTSFQLNGSTTYGMALSLQGGPGSASHAYTNGTGGNQNYSNADIALSLGTASNVLFTAPLFSPRVWNGTIHYSQVPEPATFVAIGAGLALLVGLRRRK